MYSILFEKVIYPLIEARKPKGRRRLPYLRFLRKTEWWSLEQLKELQLKRLRSLLSHAYSNVPYYRKIFNKLTITPGDIKAANDLIKLPILTKADVRNNIEDMIAKNYKKKDLFLNATGGSTGEPLHFYTDRIVGAWNMATAYRAWQWSGYNIGDKIAYIWGAPQDVSPHRRLKGKVRDALFQTKMLDAFNITEDTLHKFIREMRRFRPKVINAYASVAYMVARYLLEKGIKDIRPKAVLTTAEMLYDEQRETVEKAFSCPIYDYYSGRDTTLQATECSHHSGYHMSVETTVVEFIRNGQPVTLGEYVLIKPNFVMPQRKNGPDMSYMVTHPAVIRAIVDYVFLAAGPTGKITIADTPFESCNFLAINDHFGLSKMVYFLREDHKIPVEMVDLRNQWLTYYQTGRLLLKNCLAILWAIWK